MAGSLEAMLRRLENAPTAGVPFAPTEGFGNDDPLPLFMAMMRFCDVSLGPEMEALFREGATGFTACDGYDWSTEQDRKGARFLKLQRTLEDQLVEKLRRGELQAVGFDPGQPVNSEALTIPAIRWCELEPHFRKSAAAIGKKLVLTGIRVLPPHEEGDAIKATTGAPGRPSNMHLIEAEYERRQSAGITETTLADEARALRDWFKSTHKDKQCVTVKTIENRIRQEFRNSSGGAPTTPKL